MKNLILALLIILAAIGCTGVATNDENNKTLIDNYVVAVENMDYDAMDIYLDSTYLGLGPSYGDSIGKNQAIENWKNNIETLYESIKYKKSRNVPVTIATGPDKGEWVSNWAEVEITYKKDQKKVIILASSVYKIVDNKIVKSYTFYNEADALRQLGFVFINPNSL